MTYRTPLLVFLVLASLCIAGVAGAEMWRYSDDRGEVRFAGSLHSIPPELRAGAVEISAEIAKTDKVQVQGTASGAAEEIEEEEGLSFLERLTASADPAKVDSDEADAAAITLEAAEGDSPFSPEVAAAFSSLPIRTAPLMTAPSATTSFGARISPEIFAVAAS